ncbi:hypothetical protein NDU88_001523 [Pleurodeles waltl]|uniref:Uncharacterized protein n=1 Tax=Pleurodeles waltl TaxID=8319 RepID=A0AAV7MKP0_PLEWA|nr:hypothetical protein NDU88_001523 [Pleurodeles waltl]
MFVTFTYYLLKAEAVMCHTIVYKEVGTNPLGPLVLMGECTSAEWAEKYPPIYGRTSRKKEEIDRWATLEETARHSGVVIRGGEEAWRQEGIESAAIRHSKP